jgi:predicted TIM-barrel fold metal-dependent hydrolase
MKNISRRDFLAATTAGLAMAPWLNAAGEAAPAGPILDTHTHFYDPTRPQGVPWPPKNDRVLYRRVLPGEFKQLARPHGICGTVVVEASAWIEDNQWILDLAEKERWITGLIGHLTPGSKGFLEQLRRFSKNPLFRGIRLWSDSLKSGVDQAHYMADLKMLVDLDLAADVLVDSATLPLIARVGQKLPELRMIIDHVANVHIDGRAAPTDWLAGLRAAAAYPQVYCKVSGLVEGSGKADGTAPREESFYRPILDAVYEVFGEDRVIYGSNWPVSELFADYATVFNLVNGYFSAKGAGVHRKYFYQNAVKAYKFVQRNPPGQG